MTFTFFSARLDTGFKHAHCVKARVWEATGWGRRDPRQACPWWEAHRSSEAPPTAAGNACPSGACWRRSPRAYLDGRLDRYPGRKHETGVQRLGAHSEVHAAPGITGPHVLVSTRQARQFYSPWAQEHTHEILLHNDSSFTHSQLQLRFAKEEMKSVTETTRQAPPSSPCSRARPPDAVSRSHEPWSAGTSHSTRAYR